MKIEKKNGGVRSGVGEVARFGVGEWCGLWGM